MRTIGSTLGRTVDQLYPIDSGTAGSQVARDSATRVERARQAVARVQSQLANLHPPAKIAAEHRDLRKAVAALIAQMDKLATAIRTGDGDTFNQLSQLPAVRGVSAATDAMVNAGYDVLGP